MSDVEQATWSRAVRLFRDFRVEQSDPDRFYQALATDSIAQLRQFTILDGARVLDVGGGPGYFADEFAAAGAWYVPVEYDHGELSARGGVATRSVMADGARLPFHAGAFDVVYSSNVLEHVPDRAAMVREMVRVAAPGGLVFAAYTVWFGPWGGHETSPWHFFGGMRARRRYARKNGREPKNKYGESMFAVTVAEGLRLGQDMPDAELVGVFPRYLPRGTWWLLRVPGVREVVTWNLALVWRRRVST
jgi:SAM-dependent methyltransferase